MVKPIFCIVVLLRKKSKVPIPCNLYQKKNIRLLHEVMRKRKRLNIFET